MVVLTRGLACEPNVVLIEGAVGSESLAVDEVLDDETWSAEAFETSEKREDG